VADERIGGSHTFVYQESPFWDGHCLNKDIPAFVEFTGDAGVEAPLMNSVLAGNDEAKRRKRLADSI